MIFSYKLLILFIVASPLAHLATTKTCIECDTPYEICDYETNTCVHKPIFPMYFMEFIGIILITVGMASTTAASVGGGAIMVPLFIIFYQFTAHQATAMSNFLIFFTSTARYLMNMRDKNPEDNRKGVVDFDAATILLPTALLGSYVGVFVAKLMPSVLIVILLTILCFYITITTSLKAKSLYDKETVIKNKKDNGYKIFVQEEEKRENKESKEKKNNLNGSNVNIKMKKLDPILSPVSNMSGMSTSPKDGKNILDFVDNDFFTKKIEANAELDKIIIEESSIFPLRKIVLSLLLLSALILTSVFRPKSGKVSIIGVRQCSAADFFLLFFFIAIAIVIIYFSSRLVKSVYEHKLRIGYKFSEKDIRWNQAVISNLSIRGVLGGAAGGALGIGGALVFNPILLDLNLPPAVSTNTGMYIVIYSSFANSVQYLIAGDIEFLFGLWMCIFGIIGTYWGVIQIKKLVEETGRQSVLIIALALVMGLTCIITPLFGTLRTLEEVKNGGIYGALKVYVLKDV